MAASSNQTYQKYILNIAALYKQRQDLKDYVELLFSLSVVIVFVVFAIKPTLVTIGSLFSKISVEQDTSNQLDTKIKNLGIAQNLFNNESSQIKLLEQAVPSTPAVGDYVRQIEGLIKKDGLTTISETVASTDLTNASASAEQSILNTISVSGSYEALVNFVKDVENLRRPGFITKMDFVNASSGLSLTITPLAPYSK